MATATETINERPTIDRLDKPSAYYIGRVYPFQDDQLREQNILTCLQNKKRKFNQRDDDDVGREAAYRDKTPDDPEDELKDATTLYVGNLCVDDTPLAG